MLAIIVLLAALSALLFEVLFVVSLVGFLVVIELTTPVAVTPGCRRRLRWLVLLGLVVFAYVVVRRLSVLEFDPGIHVLTEI